MQEIILPIRPENQNPNPIGVNAIEYYVQLIKIASEHDVINLTHGNPFFPPHPIIRAEMQRISDRIIFSDEDTAPVHEYQDAVFLHKYRWPNEISPDLLTAARNDFQRSGIPVKEDDEIMAGCGAAHLFNAAMYCLNQEGGKVLVPMPTYGIFMAMASRMKVEIVPLPTIEYATGNKIDINALAKILNEEDGIQSLLLIHPDNPSGTIYTENELETISRQLLPYPIPVVVDETLDRSVMDPSIEFTSLAALTVDGEPMYDRTVTLRGVSKNHGLVRCRVGYACGPRKIITQMKKVISLSIYAPGDIDQLLATAALEKTPDDYFTSNQAAYMAKRDYVISRISTMNASVNAKLQTHDINYLTVSNPQAGQYQVLSLPFFLGKTTPEGLQITDDITLGKYLLSKGLGLLPGSLFGLSKKEMKFRLTFASSDEELQKGLDRLEQVMQSFRN